MTRVSSKMSEKSRQNTKAKDGETKGQRSGRAQQAPSQPWLQNPDRSSIVSTTELKELDNLATEADEGWAVALMEVDYTETLNFSDDVENHASKVKGENWEWMSKVDHIRSQPSAPDWEGERNEQERDKGEHRREPNVEEVHFVRQASPPVQRPAAIDFNMEDGRVDEPHLSLPHMDAPGGDEVPVTMRPSRTSGCSKQFLTPRFRRQQSHMDPRMMSGHPPMNRPTNIHPGRMPPKQIVRRKPASSSNSDSFDHLTRPIHDHGFPSDWRPVWGSDPYPLSEALTSAHPKGRNKTKEPKMDFGLDLDRGLQTMYPHDHSASLELQDPRRRRGSHTRWIKPTSRGKQPEPKLPSRKESNLPPCSYRREERERQRDKEMDKNRGREFPMDSSVKGRGGGEYYSRGRSYWDTYSSRGRGSRGQSRAEYPYREPKSRSDLPSAGGATAFCNREESKMRSERSDLLVMPKRRLRNRLTGESRSGSHKPDFGPPQLGEKAVFRGDDKNKSKPGFLPKGEPSHRGRGGLCSRRGGTRERGLCGGPRQSVVIIDDNPEVTTTDDPQYSTNDNGFTEDVSRKHQKHLQEAEKRKKEEWTTQNCGKNGSGEKNRERGGKLPQRFSKKQSSQQQQQSHVLQPSVTSTTQSQTQPPISTSQHPHMTPSQPAATSQAVEAAAALSTKPPANVDFSSKSLAPAPAQTHSALGTELWENKVVGSSVLPDVKKFGPISSPQPPSVSAWNNPLTSFTGTVSSKKELVKDCNMDSPRQCKKGNPNRKSNDTQNKPQTHSQKDAYARLLSQYHSSKFNSYLEKFAKNMLSQNKGTGPNALVPKAHSDGLSIPQGRRDQVPKDFSDLSDPSPSSLKINATESLSLCMEKLSVGSAQQDCERKQGVSKRLRQGQHRDTTTSHDGDIKSGEEFIALNKSKKQQKRHKKNKDVASADECPQSPSKASTSQHDPEKSKKSKKKNAAKHQEEEKIKVKPVVEAQTSKPAKDKKLQPNRGASSPADKKKNNGGKGSNKQVFESYMTFEEVSHGLKRQELIQGQLRLNPKKYHEAFLSCPDIFLDGIVARNRALNGDIVAVHIQPRDQWKEKQFTVLEIEQAMEEDMEKAAAVEGPFTNKEADESPTPFSQPSSQGTSHESSPARQQAATPTFPFTFSSGTSLQISDSTKSPAFSFTLSSDPNTPGFCGIDDTAFPFSSSFFGAEKTTTSNTSLEFLFAQPEPSEDFQCFFNAKSPDQSNKDKTEDDVPFSFNF